MNIILEFCKDFLFEIIFALIFSGGFFALFLKKIKSAIELNKAGINRIYKYGKDIPNMKQAICDSGQIKIMSFMPFGILFNYKELWVQKIKDGCNIKIIIGKQNSLLLKELCQIERHNDNDISNQAPEILNLLKGIKLDAGDEATGVIEVRTLNTEIRNPVTICTRNDGQQMAFLTVSVPPKRSIDSVMLEYKGHECEDIEKYFDEIWKRHSEDIVLKI